MTIGGPKPSDSEEVADFKNYEDEDEPERVVPDAEDIVDANGNDCYEIEANGRDIFNYYKERQTANIKKYFDDHKQIAIAKEED